VIVGFRRTHFDATQGARKEKKKEKEKEKARRERCEARDNVAAARNWRLWLRARPRNRKKNPDAPRSGHLFIFIVYL